jgi:hypothetical protein
MFINKTIGLYIQIKHKLCLFRKKILNGKKKKKKISFSILVCWNYYLNNKKVDKKDPQNYRPITILSYMGKLCTSVSNFRLSNFFENYLLLHENQFGFRKEYYKPESKIVRFLHYDRAMAGRSSPKRYK